MYSTPETGDMGTTQRYRAGNRAALHGIGLGTRPGLISMPFLLVPSRPHWRCPDYPPQLIASITSIPRLSSHGVVEQLPLPMILACLDQAAQPSPASLLLSSLLLTSTASALHRRYLASFVSLAYLT